MDSTTALLVGLQLFQSSKVASRTRSFGPRLKKSIKYVLVFQKRLTSAYGEMQAQPSENVYDMHSSHPQQQQHYLSPSPQVQQPLPASTMASSVAALQRLSASIDVTAVAANSRSNSRASAYEDNSNKDSSEKDDEAAGLGLGGGGGGASGGVGGRPQYLTANCVVYSFYSGDLTAAIDEHFNRALKRSNERDSPANHSNESAKQQSGM